MTGQTGGGGGAVALRPGEVLGRSGDIVIRAAVKERDKKNIFFFLKKIWIISVHT